MLLEKEPRWGTPQRNRRHWLLHCKGRLPELWGLLFVVLLSPLHCFVVDCSGWLLDCIDWLLPGIGWLFHCIGWVFNKRSFVKDYFQRGNREWQIIGDDI